MLRVLALATLVALTGFSAAQAQTPLRLVDAVDVNELDSRVDISLIFGCALRYITHSPASEGNILQVRLAPGPDCGDVASSLLGSTPIADQHVVRSVDVDQVVGREVTLSVTFANKELFVLAPAGDGHGLRIRLLREAARSGRVYVGEPTGAPAAYAVNLESSQQTFDEETVRRAKELAGVPAYVSEYQLADQKWYRLRAGPITTEAEARRVLMAVRTTYPRAWLAIADDESLNSLSTTAAESAVLPTQPRANATMTQQDIDATLNKAKKAFSKKDYATAIPLLTKVLEQPEFPRRAEAQELMGLTRERNRQLAHAKAEYQEYLRRYPDGKGVKRVKERLRALAWATRPGASANGLAENQSPWRFYGGASQIYRRDDTQLENAVQNSNLTTQNALINDVDLVARRRGERFDFATRLTAGYNMDMLNDGPGDQARVNTAYVEFGDRELDWNARLGRQQRNAGGLFGTMDGLYAGYQMIPAMRLSLALGYPVDSTTDSVDTSREFAGLSADFGPFGGAWDFSLYTVMQRIEGDTDRQAVGTEVHYYRPGRTLVALVDYDIHYQDLNSAVLLGTLELPGRWTVTANLDHRKSPPLGLRNALIGQPFTTFDELLNAFPLDQVEQLALDRTADTDLYSFSVSRPVGERWQWMLDYSNFSTSSTPASGGVDAVEDLGAESAISLQGIVSSLFGGSDFTTFGLRHQDGPTVKTDSFGVNTRFPLWGAWRLGPRLRIDRRQFATDGSEEMVYAPVLRLDLQTKRVLFECEGGAEFGDRTLGSTSQKTTRYYFSIGYRMNF